MPAIVKSLLLIVAIGSCCCLQANAAVEPNFDITSILNNFKGSKQVEMAKKIVEQQSAQLQQLVSEAKGHCIQELGMPARYENIKLMLKRNPTGEEKCLLECILKKSKFMDKTNKLSTRAIGKLAGMMSNNNDLIVSVATATAENCNRRVKATDACEAAHQINQCIGKELVSHKIKLTY